MSKKLILAVAIMANYCMESPPQAFAAAAAGGSRKSVKAGPAAAQPAAPTPAAVVDVGESLTGSAVELQIMAKSAEQKGDKKMAVRALLGLAQTYTKDGNRDDAKVALTKALALA